MAYFHFFPSGLAQVLRRHHDPELAIRVEVQKPRLRQRGDLRRAVHVDDQNRPTSAVQFGKVDGLGLGLVENALDRRADCAFPDSRADVASFVG